MQKYLLILLAVVLIGCKGRSDQTLEYVDELPELNKLWNYRDPAASEQVFRTVLKDVNRNTRQGYYLELMTQIARTYSLRYEFDRSHALLDTVSAQLTDEFPIARVRYLLERGRAFNSAGNRTEAKPLFLDAFETATENKADYLAIDAAHMLGIAEPPLEQIKWNLKAMELAEDTEDQDARSWLGPLYNNTGWSYHDLGDYNSALTFFEKGLKFRQEINDAYGIHVARWTIARTYRSLERNDEALEIQLALEQEAADNEQPPDGYVFEELGELYLLKEDSEKSRKYFGLAYQLLSQDPWLQQNEGERLARLKELSE